MPPVAEATVTSFLFDYSCNPGETRRSRVYLLEFNADQIGEAIPLSLPSAFPFLTSGPCPRTSFRPSVPYLLVRASPECTPSSYPTRSVGHKLTVEQTYRCRMYTSVDVFQTVSKRCGLHKTHGESFSGKRSGGSV